jgi:hypothetical protein
LSDDEPSIGRLYEELDEIKLDTHRIGKVTTEIFEKQLAGEIHELANVVADVIYLVREHLSCHDCRIVDHTHGTEGAVEQVYDGVVDRVDG